MSFARRVLLVMGLLAPSVAMAQSSASLGAPRVQPPVVQEGEPVFLLLQGAPCGYDPPVFSVSNFVVSVTHAVAPECGLLASGFGEVFPLGTFPAGTYTLIYQPTNILDPTVSWPSESTRFTVVQAPQPVPATDVFALIFLGVLLMLVPLLTEFGPRRWERLERVPLARNRTSVVRPRPTLGSK